MKAASVVQSSASPEFAAIATPKYTNAAPTYCGFRDSA